MPAAFVHQPLFPSSRWATSTTVNRAVNIRKPTMSSTRETATAPSQELTASVAPLTLFSLGLSNYAMRNRYIAARKGISSTVLEVASPADLGGMKCDAYLALNPLGKVPALVINDAGEGGPMCIIESNVISAYLIERFETTEPSFLPDTPERRAMGAMVAAICDTYIGPLHPYMYKPVDEGVNRAAKVAEMWTGFDAIESIIDAEGPFVAGASRSIGDAALFGRYVCH
jgi:glutathione S-transferase